MVFLILQILCAAALIFAVAFQTTKSESGLSGVIGGKSSSSFRGRPGVDEQLSKLTKWAAISFVVLSALLAIASNNHW